MDLPRNTQFEVHRVDRLAESNGQLCAMQGSLGVCSLTFKATAL